MTENIIKTKEVYQKRLELLNSLNDIAETAKVVKKVDASSDVNEIDQKYKALNCKVKSIDPKSAKFKKLEAFFNNSKESGNSWSKQKCLEIFEVERPVEKKKFNAVKAKDNNKLLWHGSSYFNFGGILSQGMRIAPPEAPRSGYMLDKGVYFADIAQKSTGYCRSHQSNGIGLMLLCDVALGKEKKLNSYNCKAKDLLKKEFDSIHGVGRITPNPT